MSSVTARRKRPRVSRSKTPGAIPHIDFSVQKTVHWPPTRGHIQPAESIQKKFTEALDELVAQVRRDRSILAAILCGSLSHDTVWAKSDIDLVLVTIDDKKARKAPACRLYADGVNVHAFLMPARRISARPSKAPSAIPSCTPCWPRAACSTPTTRPSPRLCAACTKSASATPGLQLFAAATHALALHRQGPQVVRHPRRPGLHRALDSLRRHPAGAHRSPGRAPAGRSRGDPAGHEAESRRSSKPSTPACSTRRRRARTWRRRWTRSMATSRSAPPTLFEPLLEHLREVGEARSATEIEAHFKRNFNVEGVDHRLRVPGRPRPDRQGLHARPAHQDEQCRSSQELAFVHLGEEPDEF